MLFSLVSYDSSILFSYDNTAIKFYKHRCTFFYRYYGKSILLLSLFVLLGIIKNRIIHNNLTFVPTVDVINMTVS